MSSDSDSDIEFLAALKTNNSHTNVETQPRQDASLIQQRQTSSHQRSITGNQNLINENAELKRIQAEYWEKLGENQILRSQLNKSEADHQRNINELVARQIQDKEEHKKEIEDLKRALAKEKIQHEFLLIELRSRNSATLQSAAPGIQQPSTLSNVQPNRLTPSSSEVNSGHSISSTTRRRTAASAAFGDGFTLKKPKIVPNSLLSSQPGAGTPPTPTPLPTESRVAEHNLKAVTGPEPIVYQADSSRLMAFLIGHKAPGFVDNSLQVLFSYKTSAHSSIGQELSKALSLSEFVTRIVDHIESLSSSKANNDAIALLLSLLYDSLFLDMPLGIHQSEIVTRFCTLLIEWIKELTPLPSFKDLEALNLIRMQHMRLFTCVLYTLDVLLAFDWDYEIPYELCRRILFLSQAPQVYARGIDLMAAHPQQSFTTLLTFQFPSVPFDATVEILFSGLSDSPKLTAIELSLRSEGRSKLCKLAPRVEDLNKLKIAAEQRTLAMFHYIQTASIRLADALVRIGAGSSVTDQHVLSLLSSSVDSYTISRKTPSLTEHCVFYLWCQDTTSLKTHLEVTGITELCVCLTKLIHQQINNESNFLTQCRQLLGFLGNGDENDRLDYVFEPIGLQNSSFDQEDVMMG